MRRRLGRACGRRKSSRGGMAVTRCATSLPTIRIDLRLTMELSRSITARMRAPSWLAPRHGTGRGLRGRKGEASLSPTAWRFRWPHVRNVGGPRSAVTASTNTVSAGAVASFLGSATATRAALHTRHGTRSPRLRIIRWPLRSLLRPSVEPAAGSGKAGAHYCERDEDE